LEERTSREDLEAAACAIVQRTTEKLLEVGLDEAKVCHRSRVPS
jgi:hypothetical protein